MCISRFDVFQLRRFVVGADDPGGFCDDPGANLFVAVIIPPRDGPLSLVLDRPISVTVMPQITGDAIYNGSDLLSTVVYSYKLD